MRRNSMFAVKANIRLASCIHANRYPTGSGARRVRVTVAVEVLNLVPDSSGTVAGTIEINGTHRGLAVSARNIQHIRRLAEPGHAAMQRTHEGLSVLDAGA